MALSFVPDGVFLVCTNGIVSQKLFVRSQSTVLLNDGRPMATTYDRMTGDFLCPAMVLAGPAIAGLAATVFAGTMVAALAITTVSSIALARITGIIPCFCGMLTTAWFPFHFVAQGNGLFPILESSKLSCTLGGTVTIAFTQAKADALVSYNRNKFALDFAEGLSYLIGIGAVIKGIKVFRASVTLLRKTLTKPEVFAKIFKQFVKGVAVDFVVDKSYDYAREIEINDISLAKLSSGEAFGQQGIDKDVLYGLKEVDSASDDDGFGFKDGYDLVVDNLKDIADASKDAVEVENRRVFIDTFTPYEDMMKNSDNKDLNDAYKELLEKQKEDKISSKAQDIGKDVGFDILKKILDDLTSDNLLLTGYSYAVQQADKIEEQMEKRRIGAIEEKF